MFNAHYNVVIPKFTCCIFTLSLVFKVLFLIYLDEIVYNLKLAVKLLAWIYIYLLIRICNIVHL